MYIVGLIDEIGVVFLPSPWGADASAVSAARKAGGNSRPRFSARRRMPRAAFGLKKNRGGTRPSTMADNEHAAPSLGDSEMLAVQYPVGPPVPAVFQSFEQRPEVAPTARAKKPWNILKQQPSGLQDVGHPQELPEEPAALSSEAGPLPGDGEILAGEASAEEIKTAIGIASKAGLIGCGFTVPVWRCH